MTDRQALEIGLRFARALAEKDAPGLAQLLDPEVDFRGLTPSEAWQASTPVQACEIVFGSWFEAEDIITQTLAVEVQPMADRQHLTYRFRVESGGETFLVEQHAYYDAADGRITRMTVLCSGYCPWPD